MQNYQCTKVVDSPKTDSRQRLGHTLRGNVRKAAGFGEGPSDGMAWLSRAACIAPVGGVYYV